MSDSTPVERSILEIRPGITGLASIVFADEEEILKGVKNPTLAYDQMIRPWKSRLELLYLQKRSFWLDIRIIALTLIAICSRKTATRLIHKLLSQLDADQKLIDIAARRVPFTPCPPPGASKIVMNE